MVGKPAEKSYGKCQYHDHRDDLVEVSYGQNGNSPEYKDQGPEVPEDAPSGGNVSEVTQQYEKAEGDQDNGPENMSEFHKSFIFIVNIIFFRKEH